MCVCCLVHNKWVVIKCLVESTTNASYVWCLAVGASSINIEKELVTEWPHDHQTCAGMFEYTCALFNGGLSLYATAVYNWSRRVPPKLLLGSKPRVVPLYIDGPAVRSNYSTALYIFYNYFKHEPSSLLNNFGIF